MGIWFDTCVYFKSVVDKLDEYFLLVTAPCFIFIIVTLCINIFIRMRRFKIDSSNPFIRYCTRCGQRQDNYATVYNEEGWWEDVGEVPNTKCQCHKYTRQ